MYELIEINPETGEEDQLICQGNWDDLETAMDEAVEAAEDDGYDTPWLRIQPAE